MKNKILLFSLLGIALLAYSQNEENPKEKKFFGGLAFDYMGANIDLTKYSTENLIDGNSFGWDDWEDSEIQEFNYFVKTTQTLISPSLMFGMSIFDKPDNPWSLIGKVNLGYLFYTHKEEDKNIGTSLLDVQSDAGFNLFSRIEFRVKYSWNKWNLAINPMFMYGLAHSQEITYDYLPAGSYITEYDLQSQLYFPKVNLIGGYSIGSVNVFAGLGLGKYYSRLNLEIRKSTDFQEFVENIGTNFTSQSNMEGLAGFDWIIADRYIWGFKAAVGMTLNAQTSLVILF